MTRVQVYAGHVEKKQNNWAQISNQLLNIWLKLGIMWENI